MVSEPTAESRQPFPSAVTPMLPSKPSTSLQMGKSGWQGREQKGPFSRTKRTLREENGLAVSGYRHLARPQRCRGTRYGNIASYGVNPSNRHQEQREGFNYHYCCRASFGSSSTARLRSASPRAISPFSRRASPRLKYARACRGSDSIAFVKSAIAASVCPCSA